jgi:environmental stress-induced protein Ves
MLTELIAANSFKRMPWKNGKGKTTELIALHDPLTNELLCRLSIASVTLDGDLSYFSGCKRTLMMIVHIFANRGHRILRSVTTYFCRSVATFLIL